MGIPGSRYSRDFGGPSVIVHGASGAGGTGSVLKTCQMQDGEYKVTKRRVCYRAVDCLPNYSSFRFSAVVVKPD